MNTGRYWYFGVNFSRVALQPIDDAHDGDDGRAGLLDLLDRLEGRAAGGQDVVEDGDPGAGGRTPSTRSLLP